MATKNNLTCLLTLFLFLGILSCKQQPAKPTLQFDRFNYCAYVGGYSIPDDTSWNPKFALQIAHYVNIDKNGNCRIMRGETNDTPLYLTYKIPDSLIELIDSTFINNEYKTIYHPDHPIIYDGYTYCFNYSAQQTGERYILFIPYEVPNAIKRISNDLDSIILKKATINIKSFNLDTVTENMLAFSKREGLIPPPPKRPRFVPPIIITDK